MVKRSLPMRIQYPRLLWKSIAGDLLCKDLSSVGASFVGDGCLSAEAAKSEGTLFCTKINSGDEAFSDLRL
jgi:hypothetical protein